MSKNLKSHSSASSCYDFDGVFSYIAPKMVHYNTLGWCIEWHECTDAETGKYKRFRIRLNAIRKKCPNEKEFNRKAQEMMKEVISDLKNKANGVILPTSGKAKSLSAVLDLFVREKERNSRHDSIRVYRSQVKMLKDWLKFIRMENITPMRFSDETARQYMRYQLLEKEVSATTYNNYITNLRSIFSWMIENGFCRNNPFTDIKKKERQPKKRVIIPKEWDSKIIDYCEENDKMLGLVCMLVYSSFIRPAEICRLKVQDIHIDKEAIFIGAENAKNKHPRWAIIQQYIIDKIKELSILNYPGNFYLISTGMKPGEMKKETRDLDKRWHAMRNALDMPKEFQLYSLRDTGIMALKEQGVPDHIIVKLTGHLKTSMLEKYTHAPDFEALRLSTTYIRPFGHRDSINYSAPSVFFQNTFDSKKPDGD